MTYWDTSCVLKLYATEPDSEFWTQQATQKKVPLLSSRLLQTELACALRAKELRGEIKNGATQALMNRFQIDVQRERFRLSPLSNSILELSCSLIQEPRSSYLLRSLDALHLATCIHLECATLATTDQRLSRAADDHGIEVILSPG